MSLYVSSEIENIVNMQTANNQKEAVNNVIEININDKMCNVHYASKHLTIRSTYNLSEICIDNRTLKFAKPLTFKFKSFKKYDDKYIVILSIEAKLFWENLKDEEHNN